MFVCLGKKKKVMTGKCEMNKKIPTGILNARVSTKIDAYQEVKTASVYP